MIRCDIKMSMSSEISTQAAANHTDETETRVLSVCLSFQKKSSFIKMKIGAFNRFVSFIIC